MSEREKALSLAGIYRRIEGDPGYRNDRMGCVLVPGRGSFKDGSIVLVGEAPGREEEEQRTPFVGMAGKNLNKLLGCAGLSREDVFITNVVKYRPVKGGANRKPSAAELRHALPYLLEELETLKPGLVVCLGLCAAQTLTGNRLMMDSSNGALIERFGKRILITYHPSPLNYMIARKREAMAEVFQTLTQINRAAPGGIEGQGARPMIKNPLSFLFAGKPARSFSAWQVELTTRCPLMCSMCARSSGKEWAVRDMDIDDFRRISGCFSRVDSVVLQGWGEPLLYKHLVEAVSVVNSKGAKPGFVTSGSGLTRELARELLQAGLDFIGFSISGAAKETHEAIRINSDFDRLAASIEDLSALKRDRKTNSPRIHIVFLMVKRNIHELPGLVELAGKLGAAAVAPINLVLVGDQRQDEQKVFGQDRPEYVEILKEAREKASALGLGFQMPALSAIEVGVCGENPLKYLYISADGEVSPCVFLYPPVSNPHRIFFCGRETMARKVSFGNIFAESFENIWNSKSYSDFRNCWAGRMRKFDELYSLLAVHSMPAQRTVLPEPPEPCRICHRSLGF